MTPYTPRQLRTIADRLENLTKARQTNAAMGVPTTPDRFSVRFPSGHIAVAYWARADLTSATSQTRTKGEAPWRYILDLGPNDPGTIDVQANGHPDEPGVNAAVVDRMGELVKARRGAGLGSRA